MGYVLPRTVIEPAAPRAQRPRVATRAALQRQQSRAGRSGARAATLVAQRGRARTVLIHAVKIHDGARGREQPMQPPALSTSTSKPVTVYDTSFHEGVGSALWSM